MQRFDLLTVDYCGIKPTKSVQSELSARQLTVHRLRALQAEARVGDLQRKRGKILVSVSEPRWLRFLS